jgi:hypothetical protein
VRWIAVGCVVVLALGAGVYVVRHRPVTPDQFTSFVQRLDALPAPSSAWTAYDPSVSGYAAASDQGWMPTSEATWTNMEDPSSWVAVHGWQTTVPNGDAPAACRAAVAWMSASATALGLGASDSAPTQLRCEAVVEATIVQDASVSDAWAGQGMQTTDGEMRYRTGSILTQEQSDPGYVTLAVMADATVFRG